ncbi:MAG: hypothetical protein U9P71_05395 [Campylobacterota bacterium]|nr:hypothetical protein [Campylobacterota bacterium]
MKVNVTIFLLAIFTCNLLAEYDYTISNTNFTISQGSVLPQDETTYLYNYNRLRYRGDYYRKNYFATAIADVVNYLGDEYVNSPSFKYVELFKADTPFKTQTSFHSYNNAIVYAKLYRLYGGYEDEYNRVVIGLQNISMGVGRIWTPTNLFNPRNSYALEPDETFGVAALAYTRHIDDMSSLTVVASQKADNSFKYAGRYTASLNISDIAINLIHSNETDMAGFEIEGNLADTGVEVRTEGAYIKTDEFHFFQAIVGADYGFVNGVNVIFEALYSSKTFSIMEIMKNYDSEIAPNLLYSHFYGAGSVSYSFNLFLDASLLYIESFNEHNSRFISPTLTYTLNDYNTFSIGAMLQQGSNESEFGMLSNSYYFKYSLSF